MVPKCMVLYEYKSFAIFLEGKGFSTNKSYSTRACLLQLHSALLAVHLCVCIKQSSAKAAIFDLKNLEKNRYLPKMSLFSRGSTFCLRFVQRLAQQFLTITQTSVVTLGCGIFRNCCEIRQLKKRQFWHRVGPTLFNPLHR